MMTRRLFGLLPQIVITPGNPLVGNLLPGQCPVCFTQAPPLKSPMIPMGDGSMQPYPPFTIVRCQGPRYGGVCNAAFWQDAEKP